MKTDRLARHVRLHGCQAQPHGEGLAVRTTDEDSWTLLLPTWAAVRRWLGY